MQRQSGIRIKKGFIRRLETKVYKELQYATVKVITAIPPVIRTDCTDRQIVLLPDQLIDAYNYQTVNGSTTTFSGTSS